MTTTATTAERTMAKRIDTAVKIDSEVVRQAKIVAAYRELTLAEYLSRTIGPIVSRDLASEASKQTRPKPKPKPKAVKA